MQYFSDAIGHLSSSPSTWTPQSISNIIYSYASLRCHDHDVVAALSPLFPLHTFDPQGATNILWALGTLDIAPNQRPPEQHINALVPSAQKHRNAFGLAQAAFGLRRLRYDVPSGMLTRFRALSPSIREWVLFGERQWPLTVWRRVLRALRNNGPYDFDHFGVNTQRILLRRGIRASCGGEEHATQIARQVTVRLKADAIIDEMMYCGKGRGVWAGHERGGHAERMALQRLDELTADPAYVSLEVSQRPTGFF
eukprot:GEMP01061903.1.p1 GENE.GEMP01061903.1~~GEMP01061903.1.p1  ORF type:complete len:253 (+),score=62.31 GEMP01061903.1:324-1082(+)